MKSFTCLAVVSSFAFLAIAAPASDNALVERALSPADEPAALARMETLFTTVTGYTAVINSTAASLNSVSTAAQKSTAEKTFGSSIASINSAVVDATNDVKTLGGSKRLNKRDVAIEEREAASGLPALLALIIEEIDGALNVIIATLATTLSLLGPLVASLSGLLASLIPVVSDLLAVVGGLLGGVLGGVLGGLGAALAGLL